MSCEGWTSAATIGVCALLALGAIAGRSAAQDAKSPASGKAVAQAAPVDLGGRWELNVQASDPIQWDSDEGTGEGGGRYGGRGGAGFGGGGRGGYGRGGYGGGGAGEGQRSNRESAASREELRRIMEAQRVLTIVSRDGSVTVTDDAERVVSLKPDGAKVKEELAGEKVERTTKWDGRSLVTQLKLGSGVRVTQTYAKVNEGLQLVLAVKIEGGRFPKPEEFKRVYDQALQ
jgi:hypothetical protein